MSRNYVFAPDEYYHIYARGVEKLPVYRGNNDYQRFLESLYLLNTKDAVSIRNIKKNFSQNLSRGLTSGKEDVFLFDKGESIVDVGAYSLMPNHFHILVREKQDSGKGISKFMQKLMTSYTMYFNKKYRRTGALFGSSFKARHVTDDTHLKYLFAYIHLNPRELQSVQKQNLEQYQFSSYQDYIGIDRAQGSILDKKKFPEYFSDVDMKKEISEWLTLDI